MRQFLKRTFLFLMIPTTMFIIGLILPATPKARGSLLMAKFAKDSLLDNVKKPRIIFISGSSMSLGLNSQIIKDSLQLNPINTGIHGGLGLFYLMDDAVRHIKSGDIVVICPEYIQFYDGFAEGGEELLRAAFDTSTPELVMNLRWKQYLKIIPHIPKYSISKFMPGQYFNLTKNDFYSRDAYNQYGDAVMHFNAPPQPVTPFKTIGKEFNEALIPAMANFNKEVEGKGATLLVSFPPFQKLSFDYCKEQIHYIEKRMRGIPGLTVIGTPERYTMPDSVLFDTPYHLGKEGMDMRTYLLLEDIKTALNSQNGK